MRLNTITDPETGKVYPVPAGGSEDGESDPAPEGGDDAPSIEGDPDALGDPGTKALRSMKEQWRAERDARKASEEARQQQADAVKAMEAKLAELEGRKAEWEAEQADREKQQQFLEVANQRILKAELRAAAKGVLADPADALQFLDLSDFEVTDDGEVDRDAIAAALNDLTQAKPYLAVQDGPRFQGSADGGARNGSTKPSQLTRADLQGMSAEQITAAEDAGQLDDLLGRST